MRQQYEQHRRRKKIQHAGEQRRHQHGRGRYGRYFKSAQDVGLAILHSADARAEESGAKNADTQHHGQDLNDCAALLGVEQLSRR